ncbi:hypothetical protein HY065_02360 [Candidatus Berkelbacteria bacterium]|nr:hypothetical protein [Candidatus Berkelbacteria bacterium]
MLKGEKMVVAATRQGVMLPNIGTLIIDEGDRFGYKNDQTPKYQTLDVALWRNRTHHTQLVIGGPSLTIATKMLVDSGAKFIGHGPTTKIIVITNMQHGPEPADLVVVPSKRDLGGYQWATEVHTGHIADLEGSWPRAWLLGFDTLTSIPDVNQLEKVYLLLQRLRWLAREVYVYSQHPDHIILQEDFLDKELANRKINDLPPYCRLIKITKRDGSIEIRKMPRRTSASAFLKNIALERGDRVDIDPLSILK